MATSVSRGDFLASMFELLPEVKTVGYCTVADIDLVRKTYGYTWPKDMTAEGYRVGRGKYSIDSGVNLVASDPKPKAQKAMALAQPQVLDESVVAAAFSGQSTDFDPVAFRAMMIPKPDKLFVPFGAYSDLAPYISSGKFFPVYVKGHTSNGKSKMVQQLCAKYKRPYIRININQYSCEDDLIASKTLVDGNVMIQEGPVILAMRIGAVLLLDEIDAGDCNNLMCLQRIMEDGHYYLKLKNELVEPAPGFQIIATGNTNGSGDGSEEYLGTNILNKAFLERFGIELTQTYPTLADERKIVNLLMSANGLDNPTFAEALTKWSDSIRATFLDSGSAEIVTPRRIRFIIESLAIVGSPTKAVEDCCKKFTAKSRNAFVELFKKLYVEEATPAPASVNATNDSDISV